MNNMFEFQYNDGGRKEAGFKTSSARDCVTRSVAIVSGIPYMDVYKALAKLNSEQKPKNGKRRAKTASHGINTREKWFKDYMTSIGFEWVPTMKFGVGCNTHLVPSELPKEDLVVMVSRHATAIVNGVLHDTHEPSREGNRCVYGYFRKVK